MAKTTPTTMKSDPLAAAGRTRDGESVQTADGKASARALVEEAAEAFPNGVPEESSLHGLDRDRLLNEANKVGITLGVFMNADELALVLEHDRLLKADQIAGARMGDGTPAEPRPESPPVPMPLPDRIKLRGVPDSPSGLWRTMNEQPKTVSLTGQMTVIKRNALINERHYTAAQLQAIADSGIPLKPVADEHDEG